MKSNGKDSKKSGFYLALSIITAILFNVISATLAGILKLPAYFDFTGTLFITVLAGPFPGILTAVVTNLICAFFDNTALYFTLVDVLTVLFTVWYTKKRKFDNVVNILLYILTAGAFWGFTSSVVQWSLFGGPASGSITEIINMINIKSHPVALFTVVNIAISLFEKGICTLAALTVIRFMPAKKRHDLKTSMWKQRPLSSAETESMTKLASDSKYPLRIRVSAMLAGVSLALVLVMGWVTLNFYSDNIKKESAVILENSAAFAADTIDADSIASYLAKNGDNTLYLQTENTLYRILSSSSGLTRLSIIRVREKGLTYIFDITGDNSSTRSPGENIVPPDDIKNYLPSLLAGENIPSTEIKRGHNRYLITFKPIYDRNGNCICYACSELSLKGINNYTKNLFLRIALVVTAFLLLIVSFALWITNKYIIYPINSMAAAMENLVKESGDQKKLDENYTKIRSLNINTEDEVEKLYNAICDMTKNQAEQMRDIRYLADSTAKMQDGLIITMANMVENRDSDTGSHIQKTASYVKIIVEGLKKKGYYADKITTKFMSDIVRSAPLHDVGKINISDTILNKPGKLTPEEYEIMKTHTTAGKQILEDAINMVKGESYLKEAKNMAAYHHERWDGKGYPEGLKGEVIPLSARIMAVADVFDALSSPRVYKKAFPFEKALEILKEGDGTQFDPKCIEAFMDSLPEVKKILKQYDNTL